MIFNVTLLVKNSIDIRMEHDEFKSLIETLILYRDKNKSIPIDYVDVILDTVNTQLPDIYDKIYREIA